MEVRQLAYFVAVAEELSFGRAAGRLRVVQSAVSQQVRRLERQLGVALFDRTSRSVRLTPAGERLLPSARAVLDDVERVRRVAAEVRAGDGGQLRIGTSQGLGERLERVVEALAASAPGLRVRLVSAPAAERIARVRSGALDAAFIRGTPTAAAVEVLPQWEDPLTVALPANHPLAGRPVLELRHLADLPLRLAARTENPAFHDLIVDACAGAGFTPRLGPPFTTVQDTLAEIGTGPATWTVLYTAVADLTPVRRVALRPLLAPKVVTSLAVPSGPPTPALRHLLAACAAPA